jgi:hypothetical protein
MTAHIAAADRTEALVAELAAVGGILAPRLVLARTAACGRVCRAADGEVQVRIDPRVLRAPDQVQRQLLAHELAHVALGHVHGRAFGPWRWRAIVELLATGTVAMAGGLAERVLGGRVGVSVGVLAVGLVAGVLAVVIFCGAVRPRELEADRAAFKRFGVLVDDRLFDWMRENGFAHRYPEKLSWLSTHPSPRRRLLALEQSRTGRS